MQYQRWSWCVIRWALKFRFFFKKKKEPLGKEVQLKILSRFQLSNFEHQSRVIAAVRVLSVKRKRQPQSSAFVQGLIPALSPVSQLEKDNNGLISWLISWLGLQTLENDPLCIHSPRLYAVITNLSFRLLLFHGMKCKGIKCKVKSGT